MRPHPVIVGTAALAKLAALAALAGLAAGCQRPAASTSPRLLAGESRSLGAGDVRTWTQLDSSGHPAAVGITFSDRALSALFAHADTSFTMALPAAVAAPPFDHLEVDWRPGGHPPGVPKGVPGPYDRPHLSVRFFLIAPPARDTFRDSAAAARVPELALIPGSYVPLPGLLPHAGSRWTDPTAPELNGEPLTSTLLYGFYDGQPAFLETLIARAFLEGRVDRAQALTQPRRYARPGYYPTRSRLGYDARTREFTVALEGLVLRNSPLTRR